MGIDYGGIRRGHGRAVIRLGPPYCSPAGNPDPVVLKVVLSAVAAAAAFLLSRKRATSLHFR
jgi:hypothetical protein